jgi:ligand-binding sensor domain-containing protein/serine phosphatase RsbU (regulator of sigma subunit)
MILSFKNQGNSGKLPLILILFILAAMPAFSQQYFFRKFSIEEGLPQSNVYCLLQDSKGYTWIGTDGGGVARFDGNKFIVLSTVDGLSDNMIRSLYEDRDGNIWIGTINGINYYDGISVRQIKREDGFKGTSVLQILQSEDGTIWAATNDEGLFGITLGDSLQIRNFSRSEGLSSYLIWDIFMDKDKKLWLGIPGGLNIFTSVTDSAGNLREVISPDFNLPPEETLVTCISEDKDGTLWLGCAYGKGLFRAMPSVDGKRYIIVPSQINTIIPELTIWDILCRENGELWIATDNDGILRVKDDKIIGRIDKRNGLPTNQIYRIIEDREGNTLFATLGQGVVIYGSDRFLGYRKDEGMIGNEVFSILLNSENDFYASTEEGLLHLGKNGEMINRLSFHSSKSVFGNAVVNSMYKAGSRIWAGTSDGLFFIERGRISEFDQKERLPHPTINCLLNDSHNNLWIGTSGGFSRFANNVVFNWTSEEGLIDNEVQTIFEDSQGTIWMGTVGGLVRLRGENFTEYTDFNAADGLATMWINCLAEDRAGNIWIGTSGGGIFKFDKSRDSIPINLVAVKGVLASSNIKSLLFINDTTLLAGTDIGFDKITLSPDLLIRKIVHFGLNDGFTGGEINVNSIAKESSGIVWFGTKNGLVRFNPFTNTGLQTAPVTSITDLRLFFKKVDWQARGVTVSRWSGLPEKLVLPHKDNDLIFDFTGITFQNPENISFSYILEPQNREWTPYSNGRDARFPGLSPGNYTFRVRSMNKFGIEGNVAQFSFTVKPPFWKTTWFLGSSAALIIILLVVYVRLRERNLIREKIKLENIVKERTREVVEQKDEIARQRDVVTVQKKEITDSISYAKRIQVAVLPDEHILKETFSDHFILYKPKDIVSGDFFWMSRRNDIVIFTAADCTGHGVPGAFMSMLGVSFLNKIVNEIGIVEPKEILKELRENVVDALKQKGARDESKDGMDIALCSYNRSKRLLSFSGANNPLYIFRKENGQYILIDKKADSMPIGIHERMDDFTQYDIEVMPGDSIYLFSDGYVDQFGGPDGKKFMRKRFIQMLTDNQEKTMTEQKEVYQKIIDDWIACTSEKRPHAEQTDDITLFGVKI